MIQDIFKGSLPEQTVSAEAISSDAPEDTELESIKSPKYTKFSKYKGNEIRNDEISPGALFYKKERF
jgi:hypothetical protein